jgi:hypothetical protein
MLSAFLLGACVLARDSSEYISPAYFEDMSCQQIRQEIRRLSSLASQHTSAQDTKSGRNAVAVGNGIFLFWPKPLLAGPAGDPSGVIPRLKSEMEAIEIAAYRKACGIKFERGAPAPALSPR